MSGLFNDLVLFGRNLLDGSGPSTVLFVILIELVLVILDLLVLCIILLSKRTGKREKDYYVATSTDVTLKKIVLNTSAVRRRFFVGETFSYDGLIVTAFYSDGSQAEVTSYSVIEPTLDKSGEAMVTVKLENAVAEYFVEVEEKPAEPEPVRDLIFIELDLASVRTDFCKGDAFSCEGLVVLAHYSAEPYTEAVTDYTVAEPDMSMPGNFDVTVSYGGFSSTYTVTVSEKRELTGIMLDTSAVRTEFTVGEEFTYENLVVTGYYSAEPFAATVFDYSVETPDMSMPGNFEVVVSYGGFTSTYTVTVSEKRELTGIILDTSAVKKEFTKGDTFTYENLVVNACYNVEPLTEVVTDYGVEEPDMSMPGNFEVVVSYGGFSSTYTVTVSEKRELTGIMLDTSAVKKEFLAGEEFTYENLIVSGCYSAEPYVETVTEYSVEVPDISAPGDFEAVVSYGGFTSTYTVTVAPNRVEVTIVRYDRSFSARLIQSDDEVKQRYNVIKNALLSYKKVKDRMSWKRETYRHGRDKIAIMGFRGKCLCLFLALNPADFADSKYKVEDASENSAYTDTPCMYRIRSERRMKYALQLIDIMMQQKGIARIERESQDYYQPYEGTLELINKGLIKRIVRTGYEDASFRGEAAATSDEEIITEEDSVKAGVLRYNRSFSARLIQSDDEVKQRYNEIKNALLSYKKIKDRMSWKKETYRCGRNKIAVMGFRGKSICLFLALNPADFADSKYKVEDASGNSSYTETPCMYRIRNDKRMKYALQLIDIMMEQKGIVHSNKPPQDYYMPYEGILELIDKGLIKRNIKSVSEEKLFRDTSDEDAEVASSEEPDKKETV